MNGVQMVDITLLLLGCRVRVSGPQFRVIGQWAVIDNALLVTLERQRLGNERAAGQKAKSSGKIVRDGQPKNCSNNTKLHNNLNCYTYLLRFIFLR